MYLRRARRHVRRGNAASVQQGHGKTRVLSEAKRGNVRPSFCLLLQIRAEWGKLLDSIAGGNDCRSGARGSASLRFGSILSRLRVARKGPTMTVRCRPRRLLASHVGRSRPELSGLPQRAAPAGSRAVFMTDGGITGPAAACGVMDKATDDGAGEPSAALFRLTIPSHT